LDAAASERDASTRWRDIDWDAGIWSIPPERAKNGEPHLVPLSRQAVALLTAIRPKDRKPDSLVFCTSAGTALGNWDRETKAVQQKSQTSDWHRHDLRRTGATLLGEMGELPDIVEAALNHVSIRSPLAATYNRSRYRPRVAAALQRLADALDGIEQGAGMVIPLHLAVSD
jgi:integrase